MGKKDYLTHVREGIPLQGQEQAVTCEENKQEPLKAGLLPAAEISVPLAGKSARRGPVLCLLSCAGNSPATAPAALPNAAFAPWEVGHAGELVTVSQTWVHLFYCICCAHLDLAWLS